MRMRHSRVGWLAALGAGCAIAISAPPTQAFTWGISPTLFCADEEAAAQTVAKLVQPLTPASGATVVAGTPITFTAEASAGWTATFMVASSPALLSSPDIDSGPGEPVSPEDSATFSFTSTKAAATPRTIYWTASFTDILTNCNGQTITSTVPPSTLTIVPSPAAEAAAARKNEEEAAAKRVAEEETAAAGKVSLDPGTIIVQSGHEAEVKLTCVDIEPCSGQLILTARRAIRDGTRKHTKTVTIATAHFLIAAGATETVDMPLNEAGLLLLTADHGYLDSTLQILRTAPLPSTTLRQGVQLQQRTVATSRKHR